MRKHPYRRMTFTRHATETAIAKRISVDAIRSCFTDTSEYYASGSHPGQYRMTGSGVCLVGTPQGDTFNVITLYLDRVITPLRPDQIERGDTIRRDK
jgi:predicted house-cleaning NTP pyrophosphatase (Maf/HAM1 superfamily)